MATAKDLAMKICFCLIFFRILAFAWRDPDEVNCLQGKIAELQVSPPDWSQIILAANDAVGQGIGKVPSLVSKAFDDMNETILAANLEFNISIDKYRAATHDFQTVEQNITNFKMLVKVTTMNLMPLYSTASKQLTEAVSSTRTVALAMGHNDLSQSLENLESAAAEIFRSLSSVTEAIASDMESASYDKYQDVLPKVKANLDELASTVAELKSELNAEVGTFSDALLEPMKLSMGNEASEEIDRLTSKTDLTLENLNAFLRLASTRLKDLGDDVDNKAKEVRQRGFVQKIVHGLFG